MSSTSSRQRATACCTLGTSKHLHRDDDDDDDDVHERWTRATPSSCPRVHNHSSTDTGSSPSNRAVTSSQVRGGHETGITQRHRRRITTDRCSLHGCCSGGCQTRQTRRSDESKARCEAASDSSNTDSQSSVTASSTLTSNDSSLDTDCIDTAVTCCCCVLVPSSPAMCSLCTDACYIRARCLTSASQLAAPMRCPLLAGHCPLVARSCYVENRLITDGCCQQLTCRGCCVCAERCACVSTSCAPVCCCALTGRRRPVHGGATATCSRPVHSHDVHTCLQAHCTPPTCPPACCTSSSTPIHSSNVRPTDEYNGTAPVCACCMSHVRSTEQLQTSRPLATSAHDTVVNSSTSGKSFGSDADKQTQSKVKCATDESKWRIAAEKRQVVTTSAADRDVTQRPTQTHYKTETTSATPTTTKAATTRPTTTTTTAAAADKQDQAARGSGRVEHRRIPACNTAESRDTDINSATLPSSNICRDLPNIASDLAHITSALCATTSRPPPAPSRPHAMDLLAGSADASPSVIPSGNELQQLIHAIAGIEHDVRAMAAALQLNDSSVDKISSVTMPTDSDQTRHSARGGRDRLTSRTTAAIALLLPSTEVTITPNDLPLTDDTQTTTTRIDTSHAAVRHASNTSTVAPVQKMTIPYALGAGSNSARVKVLPSSKDNRVGVNKRADYNKYALLPATASRLPFRLATTATTTTAQTAALPSLAAQMNDRNVTSRHVDETGTVDESVVSAAMFQTSSSPDSSAKSQVTSIQRIIRHLESLSSASARSNVAKPTVGVEPNEQRSLDVSSTQSDRNPNTVVMSRGLDGREPSSSPSQAVKHTATSPLDLLQLSAKQTQTSPNSSVHTPLQAAGIARLHDDNMAVKSRSLESQQQHEASTPASTAVMPLALPRSMTTAAHSPAIPLLPPPATAPVDTGLDMDTSDTEHESARSEQDPGSGKSSERAERKRKHS